MQEAKEKIEEAESKEEIKNNEPAVSELSIEISQSVYAFPMKPQEDLFTANPQPTKRIPLVKQAAFLPEMTQQSLPDMSGYLQQMSPLISGVTEAITEKEQMDMKRKALQASKPTLF